ncbi:MAG: hypothetical protein K1W01_07880, partial [Muribaculaceae bacterium]
NPSLLAKRCCRLSSLVLHFDLESAKYFFAKKLWQAGGDTKTKKVIKDKNLFSAFFVLYDFMSPPTALSSGGSFAYAGETGNYFSAHHHFLAVDDI